MANKLDIYEKTVKKIKAIDVEIDRLKVSMEEETKELRDLLSKIEIEMKKKQDALLEKRTALLEALKIKLQETGDINEKKTIKLPSGTIRINPSVKLLVPDAKFIEIVEQRNMAQDVLVTKRQISKAAIKSLPAEMLKNISDVVMVDKNVTVK